MGCRLLTHDYQIFVLLKLLTDTIQRCDIFVYLTVDQRDQKGSSDLLHALQRLVIIIQINERHRKRLVVHLL